MKKKSNAKTVSCWCCDQPRSLCCGPFLSGVAEPETAVQLMRSRYSAYVAGDSQYLLDTWHPETKPTRVPIDPKQRWLGLSIKSSQHGGCTDQCGSVEFVARFKMDGRGHRLHEHSRFERVEGRWVYRDGTILPQASPTKNTNNARKYK